MKVQQMLLLLLLGQLVLLMLAQLERGKRTRKRKTDTCPRGACPHNQSGGC